MSRKCASCGMINFSSATVCRRCKKPLGKGCPECGHSLPEEATFCSACGAIFAADKVDIEGYKTKNLSTSLSGKEAETAETNKEGTERKGPAFQPKVHRFTRCPECWSKISAEAKFCTFCGAKFNAPLAPQPEEKAKPARPIPPQPKSSVPTPPKTPIAPQPKASVPPTPITPTPPQPKAPAPAEPAKPAIPTIPPVAEKPATPPAEAVEVKAEIKRQPPAPKRKIPVPVQAPGVEPAQKIAEPIKPPPVREEAPQPAAAPEISAAEKPVPPPTVSEVEEIAGRPAPPIGEETKPEPAPPPPMPPGEPVVVVPQAAAVSVETPPAAKPQTPAKEPEAPAATEEFEIVAKELPDQPVMVPTHFPQSVAELGIELRRVEGGTYPHPQKPGGFITVKSFALSVTPVSCAQYRHFLQATGYRQPFDWLDGNPLAGKIDCPVICVSFRDAWTFCHWAGLRLPTDEEWAVAFSGQAGSRYPWGDQPLSPEIKEKLAGRKTTWPVGSNPETSGPFGHQDLVANVRQWTLTPDPRASRQDDWPWPQGFIGLAGSSYLDPLEMAAYGQVYGILKPDLFDFVIGFRCVADIEDT